MDKSEARGLLSLHRAGDVAEDERIAEALRLAQSDPELFAWWQKEQALDETIGAKLRDMPVPAGLKERILAPSPPIEFPRPRRRNWLLAAAACLAAFAVIFSSWRGLFQPANSLADFRDEMTSFVKVDPALALTTDQLPRITSWLEKNNAPAQVNLPKGLRALDPIGCRTLRYRGHDVALICFKRDNGLLAHIFVLDRRAFPRLPDRASPQFAAREGWTSASWAEGNYAYVLTTKGDRAALERYLDST
jgi:hypothetical protein